MPVFHIAHWYLQLYLVTPQEYRHLYFADYDYYMRLCDV